MVPETLGITLEEALAASEDLRSAYDNDGEVRELLDLAMKIEGLGRNVGTHAAAVVIADRPLNEYVPLQRVQGKEEVITQWAMGDVERAGLLKMDFLGLRNLTILSKAVDLIRETTGQEIDPYQFPIDDQETFNLLCRGETKGIFQLESGGIRDLLQRMKPDHFRDIIATNALYRPGPLEGGMVDDYIQVKHRRKEAEYKHPVMKEILEETHGVMVYQEQVMRILNRLGGIELSNAYSCIKAISKKKLSMIAKFREQFTAGTVEQGLKAARSRRALRHDREVRRLRLQQEPFDRLCADRVHDGLSQGPLFGRIHGRASLGRYPGTQFQEEGFAGRAFGRLPADEHHGRLARRESLQWRFCRRSGAHPVRPGGREGMWDAGGRGHSCRAPRERSLPRPVRILPAPRPGASEPRRQSNR